MAPVYTGPLTTLTKTGLIAGTTYVFQYYATNIYGDGVASDPVSILASTKADQLAAVVTSYDGANVKILWSITGLNHRGSTITQFKILLEKKDATMEENLTYCDGTNTTIINNKYCLIPMSVFSGTYNLVLDDLIVATVEANNVNGFNTPSAKNTSGAIVRTVPIKPPTKPTEGTSSNDV
jgi:hypothetical protein